MLGARLLDRYKQAWNTRNSDCHSEYYNNIVFVHNMQLLSGGVVMTVIIMMVE